MLKFTVRSACLLILLNIFWLRFDSLAYSQTAAFSAKDLQLAESSSSQELYQEGLKHFENQEYHLAIKSFLASLRMQPDNIEADNTIGRSFGEIEEYSAAIAAFNRAIALDKNFAHAYYNRGYIYQQLGSHNLALADFERTLELTNNQHVSALFNRSLIYVLRAEYQLALADQTQATELEPKEATAYYNRALIKLTMGDRPGCLKDLKTAENLYRQAKDESGLAQVERVRGCDH